MGFEDRWRDFRRDWLAPEPVLQPSPLPRGQLQRLARGAPEVFVRVTGRPRTPKALRDHLSYISRDSRLELRGDGLTLQSIDELSELAQAWAFVSRRDSQGRQAPIALSVVLGLPPGAGPELVEKAARDFVRSQFAGHDNLQVLHTDRAHPHVHAVIRWLGEGGRRLPSHRNAALVWREGFAEQVRAHGLEVEASPRWARGIMRRGEPYALNRLREVARRGLGPQTKADGRLETLARMALERGDTSATPLEIGLARTQVEIRRGYLRLSSELLRSADQEDRQLGRLLAGFVERMPGPGSARLDRIHELLTPEPAKILDHLRERHR